MASPASRQDSIQDPPGHRPGQGSGRACVDQTSPAPGDALTLDRLLAGPDGTAMVVVDGPRRDGAAGLRAEAAALAGALQARGVGRSDVVAWQLPNWRESIVLFWACWRLGAISAPLHHRGGDREIRAQLARLGPHVVFTAPGFPARAVPGALEVRGDGSYEDLLTERPPRRRTVDETSLGQAGGAANAEALRDTDTPVDEASATSDRGAATPDDPAAVLFTAGSSGDPKGVLHTHRSLAHKACIMPRVHGLTAGDAVLMPAPLAHISGLLNGVLLPAATGMNVVLMERWDPATALDLIAAEGVSFMVGPPTFFLDLLDAPAFSPDRVASLRVVSCGGTGVTAAFVEDASRRLGARVKRSYGSTEAPTVTTWHDGDPSERAATTDGRPVGDVELRVVAPATDTPLPAGQAGELWVRGTGVAAGYLDQGGGPRRAIRSARPARPVGTDRSVPAGRSMPTDRSAPADHSEQADSWTRADRSEQADHSVAGNETSLRDDCVARVPCTAGGWFATGDLAVIDEDGWLTVVGRVDDLIIRGGENVTPAEVEGVLEAHPAVHRAVVVGLPDERLGQVVAAAVAADGSFDLDACRAWFAARGLAGYKAPTRLLRLDELPVLASGKPDRRAVRERFRQRPAGAANRGGAREPGRT